MTETPHGQGTLFTVDKMGRRVPGIVWWDLCPVCRVATPEPHDHRAADLEMILAELRRLKVEQTAPAPEPVGEREHMTRKQLAAYSGYSTKWLLDRTKDPRDPLPCYGRGGKATFRKSDYDRWIVRRQGRKGTAVSGVVDEILHEIARGKT